MTIEEVKIYVCYEVIPRCPGNVTSLLQSNKSKHWAVIFKSNNWCMRLELGMNEMGKFNQYIRGFISENI